MESGLKRILNLIAKTGDRLIISDADFVNPYVIMPLEDYENLVAIEDLEDENFNIGEMTESEILEKINNDIAIWKSQQKSATNVLEEKNLDNEAAVAETEEPFLGENSLEETKQPLENLEIAKEENKPEDQYYFEPLES